jgi:hypothetical protein
MTVTDRHYDVAFVEDAEVSGVFWQDDGAPHYSVRGREVDRAEYKLWLYAQDDETRSLMEPDFFAACN